MLWYKCVGRVGKERERERERGIRGLQQGSELRSHRERLVDGVQVLMRLNTNAFFLK